MNLNQHDSLERAFQLARSGNFQSMDEIKGYLQKEGECGPLSMGTYLERMLSDIVLEHAQSRMGTRRDNRTRRA